MKRYTIWQEEKQRYEVIRRDLIFENGWYRGEPIQRLGRFESLFEQLQREQEQVQVQMEQLRQAGQGRSADFKQLEARKALLEEIFSYFRIYVGVK